MSVERRRHVRVKPIPELPARVALGVESLVRETAEVIDVSTSGLGLGSKQLAAAAPGSRILLELMLGTYGDHRIHVDVRWARGELVGVEFADAPEATAQAIRRYIAELLERGAAG